MRLKFRCLGAALLAVVGIVALVPSAQATTRKTITFTGDAVFSSGFGYPGAPPDNKLPCGYVSLANLLTDSITTVTQKVLGTPRCTTPKPGPKPGTTVVNVIPGGNTANFSFSSGLACVKTSTSAGKVNFAKTGLDMCTFTAFGTITGFCGLSTGSGTATITSLTSAKISSTMPFKFTGLEDMVHITGGNAQENIMGDVRMMAAPGTGSCAVKAARQFTLSGSLEYKKCTPNAVPCV